jgi:hypothetical protein
MLIEREVEKIKEKYEKYEKESGNVLKRGIPTYYGDMIYDVSGKFSAVIDKLIKLFEKEKKLKLEKDASIIELEEPNIIEKIKEEFIQELEPISENTEREKLLIFIGLLHRYRDYIFCKNCLTKDWLKSLIDKYKIQYYRFEKDYTNKTW